MTFTNEQLAYMTAGAAVLAYLAWRELKEAAASAGEAVNPTSDDNLANRAVEQTGEKLTGDEHFSLGSWAYDVTHDEPDVIGDKP
jgi:hypothetical protein